MHRLRQGYCVTHRAALSHSSNHGFAAVAPHSAFFVNAMGGWALIIAAGLTAGWVLDARAQRIDFPCGSEDMPAGRVMRVSDGRSFMLDDGREIRLAALEVPTESGRDGASPRSALEAVLIGHTVALRQGEATPDRY